MLIIPKVDTCLSLKSKIAIAHVFGITGNALMVFAQFMFRDDNFRLIKIPFIVGQLFEGVFFGITFALLAYNSLELLHTNSIHQGDEIVSNTRSKSVRDPTQAKDLALS
jgi:hypothetical protein